MKIYLTGTAVALLLSQASAPLLHKIIIQPEQDTVIREYVKKQPLASAKVPGVELNVGTALPDTGELHEVPNVQYRYVLIDDRTVLVDPGTRKIVKVYDWARCYFSPCDGQTKCESFAVNRSAFRRC